MFVNYQQSKTIQVVIYHWAPLQAYVFSNFNWPKERLAVHEVAGMEKKFKRVYKLGKSTQSLIETSYRNYGLKIQHFLYPE